MAAETYIEDLIYECDCIINGDYGDDTQKHIDDLMIEMEGFSFPLKVTGGLAYLRQKNVNGVRRVKGWLRCNMATLVGSPSTNVSTNLNNIGNSSSTSNATASNVVTISQAFDALESCEISQDELAALKVAIVDLEAAKGKSPEAVCEKASRLLDLAKKGADTAKAVAPFVAAVLSAFGL